MTANEEEKSLLSVKNALLAGAGLGALLLARSFYKTATRFDLRGQVVIITGGSRGLGLAMARELAEKGAKLALCARDAEQLAKAKTELEESGTQVLTVRADLTDEQEVKLLIHKTIEHFGRLDVLINNAGIMVVGPENVMEIEDYKNVMDSNLWSALYAIKAALPHFLEQGAGRIVNICSIGGKISVPHMLPYSVSKFAMVGLSQGLASELKKDKIIVTTVIPNLMRTGSPRNVTLKGDHQAEYAWFKTADSSSLLSQSTDQAARQIIEGLEDGVQELTLTQTAKIAVALQGVIPEIIGSVMQWANLLLPKSEDGSYEKGSESESELSEGAIPRQTDQAALEYNEI